MTWKRGDVWYTTRVRIGDPVQGVGPVQREADAELPVQHRLGSPAGAAGVHEQHRVGPGSGRAAVRLALAAARRAPGRRRARRRRVPRRLPAPARGGGAPRRHCRARHRRTVARATPSRITYSVSSSTSRVLKGRARLRPKRRPARDRSTRPSCERARRSDHRRRMPESAAGRTRCARRALRARRRSPDRRRR